MLTLNNLKYHCRTCLTKLEETEDTINVNKFAISSEIEVIHLCLGKNAGREMDIEEHMPTNLCRDCYNKWLDCEELYQLLIKTEKKLWLILKREQNEKKQASNDDWKKEHKEESKTIYHNYEVERHDTNFPFYQDCHINCQTIEEETAATLKISSACEDGNNSDKSSISENLHHTESEDSIQEKTPSQKICRKLTTRLRRNKKSSKKKMESISKPDINSSKRVLYRCEPCKKYFYGEHKYEGHVKQVHEGIKNAYQCKECNKAYHFYKNLRDHIALNHSTQPLETYECPDCSKIFKTKVTLKTHQEIQHENPTKRSIICDQCGFIAANQYGLKNHIKNKHSIADVIKCEQCPKVFKNQYYLKYHTLNFHNPLNIKPFKCDICSMGFTRIALLNVHKRTHLQHTDRIKCDFQGCDVRFLFNGEKSRHMRLVHLKVKQHVCDICGEAFGTGPTLRHHRYIHTGEKPFKCNICGQGFRQRSAMKTHQKTHANKDQVVMATSKQIDVNLSIENILK